jgi:hypothetical protein
MFTGNSPKIQDPQILVFSNLSYQPAEQSIVELLTEENVRVSIASTAQEIYEKYNTQQVGKLLILDDRVPNLPEKAQLFSQIIEQLAQRVSDGEQQLLKSSLFTEMQSATHGEYLDFTDYVDRLEAMRKDLLDKLIESNTQSKTLLMLNELNQLVPLNTIDNQIVISNLHPDAVKTYQAFLPRAVIFDSIDSIKFAANVLPKLIMPDHSQS